MSHIWYHLAICFDNLKLNDHTKIDYWVASSSSQKNIYIVCPCVPKKPVCRKRYQLEDLKTLRYQFMKL